MKANTYFRRLLAACMSACLVMALVPALAFAEPVEHTATFDTAGGTPATIEAMHAEEGAAITLPAAPTKNGFTFKGWSDGTKTYAAGSSYTFAESDVTFTVQWEAIKVKVAYDANGGKSAPASTSANALSTIKVGAAPTRSGYVFKGWSDGKKTYQPGASYTLASANVTFKAQWEKEEVGLNAKGVRTKKSAVISKKAGQTVGYASGSNILGGIAISKSKGTNISGNIVYKVQFQGGSWTGQKKNGAWAGKKKNKKAMQAVKVKLTGKLAEQYDVYYRVNVKDYGWMRWAKNNQKTGVSGLRRYVRGYQVRLVKKADKETAQSLSSKSKLLFASKSSNVEKFMGVALKAKADSRSSSTRYIIIVDTHINHVCIYKGRRGDWDLVKSFKASTGKSSTPTVRGTFTVKSKGYSFGSGYTCYYFTQFHGNYLFHSVLYHQGSRRVLDGRLGQNLSHGCVRLAIGNAKWIYNNIPRGTKVYIF